MCCVMYRRQTHDDIECLVGKLIPSGVTELDPRVSRPGLCDDVPVDINANDPRSPVLKSMLTVESCVAAEIENPSVSQWRETQPGELVLGIPAAQRTVDILIHQIRGRRGLTGHEACSC